MNRHERRAAEAQERNANNMTEAEARKRNASTVADIQTMVRESGGQLHVRLVTPLSCDAVEREAIHAWMDSIAAGHQHRGCLLCGHRWTSLEQDLPAYAVIISAVCERPHVTTCSAVCMECRDAHGERLGDVVATALMNWFDTLATPASLH